MVHPHAGREHAYYLDCRNYRAKCIDAFRNIVNRDVVAQRFDPLQEMIPGRTGRRNKKECKKNAGICQTVQRDGPGTENDDGRTGPGTAPRPCRRT
ncbi:MAG: Fe-Mn family superoxide dismutase [Methanoregula sp.]